MDLSEQGFSGYYDATATPTATVGMGDFSAFFGGEPSAQYARVTTSDPAPSGDLIVRAGPSSSQSQVGGVEKDGIVTILDVSDDGGWYLIDWQGGMRRAAVQGWASARFLTITDTPPPTTPGAAPPPALPGAVIPPSPRPAPAPGNLTPASSSSSGASPLLYIGAAAAAVAVGAMLLGKKKRGG
jgi:hypothetical protein